MKSGSIKILLIEDDPTDVRFLRQILKASSYQIKAVSKLQLGIQALAKNQFDVILLNLNLPDSSGVDTVSAVYEKAPRIPILVLSGVDNKRIALDAVKRGAQDYLLKDRLTKDILSRVIRYAIERNRIIETSLRSEEKYNDLFNNSLNGFALHEIVTNINGKPIDYIFLEVNNSFEKMTGLKAKNVIGRKVTEVIPGISEEPFIEIYGKVALTGEPKRFEQFSAALGRHFEVAAFSPQKNQFVAVFTDITERKKAEETLRDHERKLRTIIEHSNELFYIHDTHHQLTYVSPQSKEILGYTPDEMMVKWTTLTTDNPINDEGLRITERAIKTGKIQPPYLLELKRKDGQSVFVEIDESPILDENGQVVGISGALRNITEKKHAELALIESEQKFRSLAEQSPNMIFINRNGKIIYANKKSTEILGFGKEELYSPNFDFRNLIAPESLDLVRKAYQNHMEGKNVDPYEYTIITKEGKRIEAINSTKLIDYEGEKAILGVVTDITERKHSEQTVKESEERLKILFEFAPDAILLGDLEGNLVNANKAAEEMTGYSREELIGNNMLRINLLSSSQIPKAAKLIARSAEKKAAGPEEFTVNKKDGGELIIEIRTYPIKIQDQFLMLGVARDITERRKAEEAIRRSEEKFRSLFEESKDAIYISSPNGKFIDINPAGVELFGYESKDDLLKVDIANDLYLNSNDRLKFQNELRRNGYVKDFELALKRKDGMKLTVLVTATSIRGTDGNISAYRGFIRDISEQKLLEQQLLQAQKMEAIGTLAGGIAHDFNNILSAILGYTELTMELMNADGLAKRNLEQVYSAGLRAKELVQQILTFSRQTQHSPRPLKMVLIVKEALKLLRASLPSTIQIDQKFENSDGHILADPTQVHQIVVNLCTNAYDAMREQGGTLNVKLDTVEVSNLQPDENLTLPPGKYVSLTISDTGSGMKAETVKRIFDPFFTTKEAGVGTGLGLSVVHGIVKKHGGEITVRSEIGKGSTFAVYLPAFESPKESMTDAPREFLTGSESILYVDDEEPIVKAGAQILEKLGYQVTGKTQSPEALETFKQSPESFDLVITDLTMPNMTGIELAKNIMKIRPDIPIILITGFSETITREKARQMGIRDLIMKPTLTADLSQAIRRSLDQQKVGS